jgi:hypothetical protein
MLSKYQNELEEKTKELEAHKKAQALSEKDRLIEALKKKLNEHKKQC